MLRFCGDTRIWPTNNISERGVRPLKTQQKISGRLTSEDVTQDRLDIRSYIDTARKHGQQRHDRPAQHIDRKPLAATRASRHLPVNLATNPGHPISPNVHGVNVYVETYAKPLLLLADGSLPGMCRKLATRRIR